MTSIETCIAHRDRTLAALAMNSMCFIARVGSFVMERISHWKWRMNACHL